MKIWLQLSPGVNSPLKELRIQWACHFGNFHLLISYNYVMIFLVCPAGHLVFDRIKSKAQYIPKDSSIPVQLGGQYTVIRCVLRVTIEMW